MNDVLKGLPFPDDHFHYIVANHSLSGISHRWVARALEELHRVTKPQGVLRILVPDIHKAFTKWLDGDIDYFPNRDGSIDERFCAYLTWFSGNVSVFTGGYLTEVLQRTDWSDVTQAGFGETSHPEYPGIVDLDLRPEENLIVEAVKV
ncbi:MAG TPA: class I SAM-dependent methyltransferase [Solirubrobacterales bacterium]|nr:class I SAM-dependent methyltransferase [Solirubrobacterales bacterium]